MDTNTAKSPRDKLSNLRYEIGAKEAELDALKEKLLIEEKKEITLRGLSRKFLDKVHIKYQDEALGNLSHEVTFAKVQEVLQGLGFEFELPEDILPFSFADFLIFLSEARLDS